MEFDGVDPVNAAVISKMTDRLVHRGPDRDGYYRDSCTSLGFRRLSIIDLNTGDQPLHNEDGSLWIVFNGEIYNFMDLRIQLEKQGHVFQTKTDTEVILHAFEQYGPQCVDYLRGMFAFAVWDTRKRSLFLARDRVGKKPLYYYPGTNAFIFGSELKALIQYPGIPRCVDPQAIDEYLTWKYIPAPRTIFEGVFKLPPAHWMSVNWETHDIQIQRYWIPEYTPKLTLSLDEVQTGLREQLTEAVRLRLVSDVPLGALLSGGVDSTIVVGLMSSLMDKPVKTFSIGFEESSHNELPYARLVARRFGSDHHEFVVRPDVANILPKISYYLDEPMADSSALPTYYVAEMARQHVTVVLNGDGGDETFAGYGSYAAVMAYRQYAALPKVVRQSMIESALRLFPDNLGFNHPLERARRLSTFSDLSLEQQFGRWTSLASPEVRQALYKLEFKSLIKVTPTTYRTGPISDNLGPLDWMLATDLINYLPGDLLVKMDRMTMANSLEARSPFLDQQIVEFSARLPEKMKRKGNIGKWLLKNTFSDLIPPEIIRRPKKGFAVPVNEWFRIDLKDMMADALDSLSSPLNTWFNQSNLQMIFTRHLDKDGDYGDLLWALLMLHLWLKNMIQESSI